MRIIKIIFKKIVMLFKYMYSIVVCELAFAIVSQKTKNIYTNSKNILFIDMKYRAGMKSVGISDFSDFMCMTFSEYASRQDVKYKLLTYWLDDGFSGNFKGLISFIKYFFTLNIEYVLVNPGFLTHKTLLSKYLFYVLAKRYRIKIITLNCDANGFDFLTQLMYDFNKFSFLNIILDSPLLVKKIANRKFIYAPAPYPELFYKNGNFDKNIDVSFIGAFSKSKPEREEYLSFLKENGINVFHAGGLENDSISREKYIEYLQRSKITINFSTNSKQQKYQTKARIFEATLANCLLLESKNPEITELFIDGVDFVSFDSKNDLLAKIMYYMQHDEERSLIAKNGCDKSKQLYNGFMFWDRIIKVVTELETDENQ